MPAPRKLRRGLLIRRRLALRRALIRRRALLGRPLLWRPLLGRPLIGLSLVLLALIGLALIRLPLITLRLLLGVLTLVVGALTLAAALHLSAMRLTLLLVLALLIRTEHAHDLTVQLLGGVTIDGAARRVRLRILIDHRLNSLLLIPGEVQVAKSLHPAVLDLCGARRRVLMACLCARLLALLGQGRDRYGKRHR